jgi:hypothetical protein
VLTKLAPVNDGSPYWGCVNKTRKANCKLSDVLQVNTNCLGVIISCAVCLARYYNEQNFNIRE